MRNMRSKNLVLCYPLGVLLAMLIGLTSASGREPEAETREQIGVTLGKPVYREELQVTDARLLADELGRLFLAPVLEKYLKEHEGEIQPTRAEIDAAADYFDERHRQRIKDEEPELRAKLEAIQAQLEEQGLSDEKRSELESNKFVLQTQLQLPGRNFAEFVLRNWKFQKHLYDRFGGGRILWQQAGLEAFDGMHQWLLSREKAGDFKITDPSLRETFYAYWTTQDHGSFLITNKERIRAEFLEPEWVKKSTKETKEASSR